jgi:hypothetical protein
MIYRDLEAPYSGSTNIITTAYDANRSGAAREAEIYNLGPSHPDSAPFGYTARERQFAAVEDPFHHHAPGSYTARHPEDDFRQSSRYSTSPYEQEVVNHRNFASRFAREEHENGYKGTAASAALPFHYQPPHHTQPPSPLLSQNQTLQRSSSYGKNGSESSQRDQKQRPVLTERVAVPSDLAPSIEPVPTTETKIVVSNDDKSSPLAPENNLQVDLQPFEESDEFHSQEDGEDGDDEEEGEEEDAAKDDQDSAPPPPPRGKPEAMAKALAKARLVAERKETVHQESEQQEKTHGQKKSTKKAVAAKKSSSLKKSVSRRKTVSPTAVKALYSTTSPRREMLLNEKPPKITVEEYENLNDMMKQFCRVPLLAEFSRPVSLLHPELAAKYGKIVRRPVDLGHVCRGIRRRLYKNCRDVRLDMWRVFANCVKFHSDPSNKEAVPSFVSIALHLREYFNNLWQEYMLPSELPPPPAEHASLSAYEVMKASIAKRNEDRRKRLENSGVLVLSKAFTAQTAALLSTFVENGGRVDKLDRDPVFGEGSGVTDREVDIVVQRLREYQQRLDEISQNGAEYSMEAFYVDLNDCYTKDILEEKNALRNRLGCRIDRFFWKQAVPLHEANSRGVTQSSIWGNIAATIWARESSKKPYWPALCLGILPPEQQREGWHIAVTERNELRLPEKLRAQLLTAKKRCEQAQKRQSLSYFLVEFLGTHEFIWVRETDIIENFDANDDPNKSVKPGSKKGRGSRSSAASVIGSEAYGRALQECEWANEEFENILQDAFDNTSDDEADEDDEDMNYSFSVLAQSDDEAEDQDKQGYTYGEENLNVEDIDEANWLLSHDGLLDTSPEGRKNAKKRAQVIKQKSSSKEEAKKKSKPAVLKEKQKEKKSEAKPKAREEKKDQRELDKRRKRRMREREKMLRVEAKKEQKRKRSPQDSENDERGLYYNKRARASAIAKAYMFRLSKSEDSRSLALSGVMTLPAAMVDSTGLLGMSLAFRAAAGELDMPDDGKDHRAKMQPWLAVDTNKPKSSSEREDLLQKQIDLLEKEIKRIRNDSGKRKRLASDYGPELVARERAVEEHEKIARQNHYKKKKKPGQSKSWHYEETPGNSERMLEKGVDGQSSSLLHEDNEVIVESTADFDESSEVEDDVVDAEEAIETMVT